MFKRHIPLPLALVSLSFLCGMAQPGHANPGQSVPPAAAPAASLDDTPAPAAVRVSSLLVPTPAPGAQAAAADPALATGSYVTAAAALAPEPAPPAVVSWRPSSPSPPAALHTGSPNVGSPATAALGATAPESRPEADPAETQLAQAAEEEPLSQDPELGVIQVRGLLEDNDLGILRIRQQPNIPAQATQPQPKIGFLSARLAIASSDNILLAANDVGGLTGDTFLRPSLAFSVYPAVGPQTVFISTVDLGLQRYGRESALNYDDLRFRVGLRQGLTPRSYGQLLFTYQELFRPGGNRSRFFKNTALGLTLGRRDPITPQIALDTYYIVQFNGAQSRSETASGPVSTDFSRIFQTAGGYLSYQIAPRWQAGISYQLNLIDYTAQERYDAFQQVIGQVVYQVAPAVRLNLYGGISFGRSSEPRVRFDDSFFGAVIEANVPIF
ncbi:MAG TPA: hypothetical protein VLS96_17425 [Nodosilinea sp.]|nr:hypothetical protein [Nodosilinea sp.]